MIDKEIVVRYLSNYRFDTYRLLYSSSYSDILDDPLGLYQTNINFSKDFYELLSYFEIFFRNKIDMVLSKYICEDWMDKIDWRDKHS